jgi:hypothetical protein
VTQPATAIRNVFQPNPRSGLVRLPFRRGGKRGYPRRSVWAAAAESGKTWAESVFQVCQAAHQSPSAAKSAGGPARFTAALFQRKVDGGVVQHHAGVETGRFLGRNQRLRTTLASLRLLQVDPSWCSVDPRRPPRYRRFGPICDKTRVAEAIDARFPLERNRLRHRPGLQPKRAANAAHGA